MGLELDLRFHHISIYTILYINVWKTERDREREIVRKVWRLNFLTSDIRFFLSSPHDFRGGQRLCARPLGAAVRRAPSRGVWGAQETHEHVPELGQHLPRPARPLARPPVPKSQPASQTGGGVPRVIENVRLSSG